MIKWCGYYGHGKGLLMAKPGIPQPETSIIIIF